MALANANMAYVLDTSGIDGGSRDFTECLIKSSTLFVDNVTPHFSISFNLSCLSPNILRDTLFGDLG